MWLDSPSDPARPHWRELLTGTGMGEAELRSRCRRRRFARHEVVFHEGDPPGALHLIDRGSVAVRLTTPLGDEVILEVLRAGDLFGEQALLDQASDRSATIVALEPTETLALDARTFRALLGEHSQLEHFLVQILSRRLRVTSARLLTALHLPAETRLLRCLHDLAVSPDGGSQDVPFTQSELAAMCGVTRSTANRVLRRAQDEGVVRIRRGRVEVLDLASLASLAGYRSLR